MKKMLLQSLLFQIIFINATKAQNNIPNGITSPATAVAKPLPFYTDPSKYYLRILTPALAIQDTSKVSINSSVDSVLTTTQYFDELHRPIEKVIKQASPLKKDNVLLNWYDEFGRPSTQYLPYVAQTGNYDDGKYKNSPFVADSAFNKSIYTNDQIYYAQQSYDGSPLNRIIKVTAPGNSWTGANVGVSNNWRANSLSDSVVLWTIAISGEDDLPVKSGVYVAGSLSIQEVIDERGIKIVSYVDESGKTVLTKKQISNNPSTGHYGWLCTYYVYDEMNHLRIVIPPKAVDILNTSTVNWNLSTNTSINTNLCYAYYYDARGRVTMKSIPGKGKYYLAYDLLDRVVMTQDPRLRITNQWTFLVYDGQSRQVKSGLITSSLSKDIIIAQAAASNNYPALTGTYTITTEIYYDDYNWISATNAPLNSSIDQTNINSTNFNTSYNTAPDYPQPLVMSNRIKGVVTGVKKLILNSNTYLYSVSFFDDNGRVLQTATKNYSGGTDITTMQYSFSGSVLRNHLAHQKSGTNSQTHTALTKYSYDHVGRLKTIIKNFDNLGDKSITQNTYNELGQLQNKILGNSVETQNYTYNIRGWLLGINSAYVSNSGGGSNFFGETLSYDYGFTNSQSNGNIAGIKWKAAGDQVARAYGFTYDNANRLSVSDFSQQNLGNTTWTKDKVDYTVSEIKYDANGNILNMTQRGLQVGTSATIDSLSYQYFTNSNQLQKVSDAIIDPSPMGDFKDTTLSGDDYTYDANGNINKDYNRHMYTSANGPGAVFNILDRPDSISIAGKSCTYYYYDVSGSLLKKQVNDYTGASPMVKTYLYLSGFVYLNDTLLYALTEEGRIRYAQKRNSQTGAIFYAYEYDYFIRDHLNNVRTVLTEGRDTATYQATMEPANSTLEDALFSNEYTPSNTVYAKPSGFDANSSNQKVSRLNASFGINLKVGPSLVLKVMAGDQVQVNTYAYYNTPVQQPQSGVNLLSSLLAILPGAMLNNSGGKLGSNNLTALNNTLSPNVSEFLSNNRPYNSSNPKAYLTWILFDNQFNFVSSNSGVVQVFTTLHGGGKVALVAPLQNISKNGYLYVYVSNESPQDVYFDDITIKHTTGALVQEQSFYPFGLQMCGISDKAALKTNTTFKFNAGNELEEGIDYYNTFYRKYDAQIGRFTGIDILAEETLDLNPYQFGANDPMTFNDPTGALLDGGHVFAWERNVWNDAYGNDPFGGAFGTGSGGGMFGNGFYSSFLQSLWNNAPLGRKIGHDQYGNWGYWTSVSSSGGSPAHGNTFSGVEIIARFVSISSPNQKGYPTGDYKYSYGQGAFLMVEGIGSQGAFDIKGNISVGMNKSGKSSMLVTMSAYSGASPSSPAEGSINFYGTVAIYGDGVLIAYQNVNSNDVPVPNIHEAGRTPMTPVSFNLPSPAPASVLSVQFNISYSYSGPSGGYHAVPGITSQTWLTQYKTIYDYRPK